MRIAALILGIGSVALEGSGEACCHRKKGVACPLPTACAVPAPVVCVAPAPVVCVAPATGCGHRRCRRKAHGHCCKARASCAPVVVAAPYAVPTAYAPLVPSAQRPFGY